MKTSIPKLHSIKYKQLTNYNNVVTLPTSKHDPTSVPLLLEEVYNKNFVEIAIIGYDSDNRGLTYSTASSDEIACYMFEEAKDVYKR